MMELDASFTVHWMTSQWSIFRPIIKYQMQPICAASNIYINFSILKFCYLIWKTFFAMIVKPLSMNLSPFAKIVDPSCFRTTIQNFYVLLFSYGIYQSKEACNKESDEFLQWLRQKSGTEISSVLSVGSSAFGRYFKHHILFISKFIYNQPKNVPIMYQLL